MSRILTQDLGTKYGQTVELQGYVDAVRKLGGLKFLVLRDRTGTTQIIADNPEIDISAVKKHDIVKLTGIVRQDERAPKGREVSIDSINVLSSPVGEYPIAVSPKSTEKLERQLEYRAVSLRNPKIRDVFVLQQTLVQAFRNYLISEDFTEIFTPKIGPKGAESGANVFKLDYFGNEACLAQSPQLYKQIMVGSGLERVFEVGHAYRAENHNTSRHLNEYLSLDIEMGFIDSFYDLLDVEEGLIRYMLGVIDEKHPDILEEYKVTLPTIGDKIPRITLNEMKDILASKYKKNKTDGKDIDPEGEKLAHRFVKEEFGSDFVFLTHYPEKVRPFYTMPSGKDDRLTESFDLLMNGLEITTGSQRIHNYNQLVENMEKSGINPSDFEGYLMAFKYGMPPHGGFGIGAERLTARFLNLPNIRQASLFPRDCNRYKP